MRTLKINGLYQCNAACGHCRFHCSPERSPDDPDFETPYAVARTLKENFGLDYAVLLGGEPSLYAGQTHALLEKLHDLGVATRLETNGRWAPTHEDAIVFLTPLKETETGVMLSLDGFHAPFVPFEYVAHALEACFSLGITCNLEVPYLDIERKDHPIDVQTAQAHERMTALFGERLECFVGQVLFVGRAAETYGDALAGAKGVPSGPCASVPWWVEGGIETTDLLIWEPGGWITKGCGVAIGHG